jgi:hypothetical protein
VRHGFRRCGFPLGAALLTAALSSSCVRGGGHPAFSENARVREEPVLVTVKNNDFRDAVLYAVWDGRAPQRIGLVTGKTEQTFTLEWRGSTVVFQAHLIAGDVVTFDRMDAWSGDHFDLVIMMRGQDR